MRRPLTTAELRNGKSVRKDFSTRPRRPITVVLDGVKHNYNIGAIFRLCDAFLIERLIICGTKVELHKRKLVQAARGTQRWVPWSERQHALEAVTDAKGTGSWIFGRGADHGKPASRANCADISRDVGARLGGQGCFNGGAGSRECRGGNPAAWHGQFSQRGEHRRYLVVLAFASMNVTALG